MKPSQIIIALSVVLSLSACKKSKDGVYEIHETGGTHWGDDAYYAILDKEDVSYKKEHPEKYTVKHFPDKTGKELGYTKRDGDWYNYLFNKDGANTPGANGYFAGLATNGGGSGNCKGKVYNGPTKDVNSAVFCQQAWDMVDCQGYSRTSAEVKQVCDIYKALMRDWVGPGAAPVCSYCQ